MTIQYVGLSGLEVEEILSELEAEVMDIQQKQVYTQHIAESARLSGKVTGLELALFHIRQRAKRVD